MHLELRDGEQQRCKQSDLPIRVRVLGDEHFRGSNQPTYKGFFEGADGDPLALAFWRPDWRPDYQSADEPADAVAFEEPYAGSNAEPHS